jgi:hypothetical protein
MGCEPMTLPTTPFLWGGGGIWPKGNWLYHEDLLNDFFHSQNDFHYQFAQTGYIKQKFG